MKKKELKNLAAKIAEAEYIVQTSKDSNAVHQAQETIMNLSGKINNLEEMVLLDDMIQEILDKILDNK